MHAYLKQIIASFQKHGTKYLREANKSQKEIYIAGSSIANAWLNSIGINTPKPNDIDIFIPVDLPEEVEITPNTIYRGVPGRIKSVERTGIINAIEIYGIGNIEDLVDKFDINAVMGGYSVLSERLYISEKLKQFSRERTMEIARIDSPLFTSLRLLKKAEQGMKCDLDKEMWIIAQALLSPAMYAYLMENGQVCVEKKRLKNLSSFLPKLQHYFQLIDADEKITLKAKPGTLPVPGFSQLARSSESDISDYNRAVRDCRYQYWTQSIEI